MTDKVRFEEVKPVTHRNGRMSIVKKVVEMACNKGLGAVHKLRNADGVGGWSAKELLLQSLVWCVIDKMTTKTLLWVGG